MTGSTRRWRHAAVLFGLLILPRPVHPADWQPPVRLTPDGMDGCFPDVATDLGGQTHVVWSTGPRGGSEDRVYYCSPTTAGCAEPTPLARRPAAGAYVTRPAAVVDHDGVFHLFWRQKSLMVYTSAPLPRLFEPAEWSRPRKLGEGAYTALALDENGSLHAAWSQPIFVHWGGPCDGDVPCYGCADIHYSRSDDGGATWTHPVNVSRTIWGSEKPHIVFDPEGTLYIAWEEGRDFHAGGGVRQSSMLSVSDDRGKTWDAPVAFTYPGDTPQSIAVGIDHDRRVVVVWQQVVGEGIFFQVSADRGRTWSPARQISGVLRRRLNNKLDDYDMAADAQGHLHLVLAGRLVGDDARHHVLHLEWDGQAWSAPTPIFTTGGAPEWPRIAVGNGNRLHAVWFEHPAGFEQNTEGKNDAIWYAVGRSDAPAIPPIAWPPPAPARIRATDWLRPAQAALAIAALATVIITTRRFGW